MSKKLKVLISAYACEPHKGSEPEAGWQWALQMARFHEVTVLTRKNNRAGIEKEIAAVRQSRPVPTFIYHDEGPFLLWVKRRLKIVRLYYILWQISAWRIVAQLHAERHFDLMHHVTFAGFRYRTAIWGHGVPAIWGPVGGVESIPWPLLPWKHPASLATEIFRTFNNFVQSAPFHVLPKRVLMSAITLVSTREMEEALIGLGLESILMPTVGLELSQIPAPNRGVTKGPLRLLFVGKVITLKGIDLAIQAFHESGIDATYTIVGDGNFLDAGRRMAENLGISERIKFRGRVSREEVMKLYPQFDVLLFPSLHDTGSYVVIEAMASGMPVICLDFGGPKVAVEGEAGIKIPLGSRAAVVSGLAGALRKYDRDRVLINAHGAAARMVIERKYDWDQKGVQLDALYQQACAARNPGVTVWRFGRLFEGRIGGLLRRFFPVRGLAISAVILFIIGTAGFFSINHLRKTAEAIVADTMPGLAYAGVVNSGLTETFNRTLLLVLAGSAEERSRYRIEMEASELRANRAIQAYADSILEPSDRANYRRLLEQRKRYVESRRQVLALLDEHRQEDAQAACGGVLLPAYRDYKNAAERVLAFNAREGKARGEIILNICTATQYGVAGAGILLFVVGFVIGLFR